MRTRLELLRTELDAPELARWAAGPETGAVAVFEGRVRATEGGEPIAGLEYEVYEEMARRQMERLSEEIARRYTDVEALALVHRTGFVEVGACAVVVVVGAGHRDEAFRACRHGIDRLKEIVPIWKRAPRGAALRENEKGKQA